MIEIINDKNFNEKVIEHKGKYILDFYADWCIPCKGIEKFLSKIDISKNGLKIGKLDIEQNPNISAKYNIRSLPTLLLFVDGNPKEEIVGNISGKKDFRKIQNMTFEEIRQKTIKEFSEKEGKYIFNSRCLFCMKIVHKYNCIYCPVNSLDIVLDKGKCSIYFLEKTYKQLIKILESEEFILLCKKYDEKFLLWEDFEKKLERKKFQKDLRKEDNMNQFKKVYPIFKAEKIEQNYEDFINFIDINFFESEKEYINKIDDEYYQRKIEIIINNNLEVFKKVILFDKKSDYSGYCHTLELPSLKIRKLKKENFKEFVDKLISFRFKFVLIEEKDLIEEKK